MTKLFGYKIDNSGDNDPKRVISPVPPNDEDKSDFYITSGFHAQYVDIEGVYKNEAQLIQRYREMALHPECDSAIEDVVNEAIVSDLNDSPVEIELSNLPASEKLKDIIRQEFKYIKEIMDFDKKCHEIFRNWYIDGRIYYHKVIDIKNPHDGIKEIRYIDALKIKYIRKLKKDKNTDISDQYRNILGKDNFMNLSSPEIEEYYLYDPSTNYGQTSNFNANDFKSLKLTKDSVTYVTSGLVDRNKQTVLSFLHKAIKALNQLRMIEDSLVIYRLSRAPERRIFYIDVGNLPKVKAEQYLRDVMMRYRNKLVYNAATGEIRDDRKHMAMLEDFWLPRREGGRGTEITTLPGGQNLGELADIEYFQKKLYDSLGVPPTRLAAESGFNLGRSSEILRDELKFTRFVGRLRKRFSQIFIDMLRTQLILKNIVTPEDWIILADHIQFDYVYDNHFSELKNNELMNDKLGVVAAMESYVGRYFSAQYVRSKILGQTDSEMKEIDAQIKKEIEDGVIMDPNAVAFDQMGGIGVTGQQNSSQNNLGNVPKDPGLTDAKAGVNLGSAGEI